MQLLFELHFTSFCIGVIHLHLCIPSFKSRTWNRPCFSTTGTPLSTWFGSEGQGMDKGSVEMEVQSWHSHYRILCQMVVDQAFGIGAWLSGRKVQTWEAFNLCRRYSTSRPCQDECSHLGKCDGCAKAKWSESC
jgi:hypothetical protein